MGNPIRVQVAVKEVTSFGAGVFRVDFEASPRTTRFKPGQFLHLTLDPFDPTQGYWPESRVFSIASEPKSDVLSVVFSVKGRYTTRMAAELRPGCLVWLKLPYGDFTIDESLLERGPVVLVAGGTGVAPYMPFLLESQTRKGVVCLFYGVREADHLLFGDQLRALQNCDWLKLYLHCEQGTISGLPFEAGRLSVASILARDPATASSANYFLSGPPVMISTFKKQLQESGIPQEQIHIDEWE